ncbi:MAG: FAD-dependent oxidoreductase, partial [Spirochaetes bacterium]|nr:FAD-dependent oxidoreductase [Spirochaetota bacterium]
MPARRSPCTVECPLETNVKAYVSLIAAGKFDEALAVVRLTNPFPGICGRVCPHVCEDQCIRGEIDEPISIAELKRFLTDYELKRGIIPRYNGPREKHGKIAVIGAGPAGLTCAADLAREGLGVTVFEALSEPGGMMAFGIPAYRIPGDILRVEIAAIEGMGIEIRLNTPVGDSIKFDDIVRLFDAVFIAAGAMRPRGLGIPGEEDIQQGLVNWVSFMREVARGGGEKPGDSVVIVGGGNTAVDCARVSLRLGVKDVRIVYRRSREEMPAFKHEVKDAEEEGVEINFLAAPVKLLVEKGKLKGVECTRMKLGKKEKSGRRRPLPVPGSGFIISCDSIISAIGQEFDAAFLGKEHSLRISGESLLVVDPDTMATKLKGVFSGGDAVTGASSVVEAIAAGHSAARSIIRYIRDFPLNYPEDEISY